MTSLPVLNEPPVVPVYSQAAPNVVIELGATPISFEYDGNSYSFTANGSLVFLPSDDFVLTIPWQDDLEAIGLTLAFGNWEGNLSFGDGSDTLTAFCGAVGKKYGGITLHPLRSAAVITPPTDSIQHLVFHLFNFPDFTGPSDFRLNTNGGSIPCGCFILEADGWQITVSATPHSKDSQEQLKAEGGYIITHAGTIERIDRSSFSSDSAQEVLTQVQYFLSFALGTWAGLALPLGYNASGDVVFEEWGIRRVNSGRWRGGFSWFDKRHSQLLPQIYPGFIELWQSDVWKEPITEIIYWYCTANDRSGAIGVDASLILAQTAIEVLAWNYCVKDTQMVTKEAFKQRGLTAADKLRLLATTLGLPKDIPDQLRPSPSKRGKRWDDALDVLTHIRNSLVHPDAGDKDLLDMCCDAWNLAMWYIELALLRLCNHQGKYANRLSQRSVLTVEDVPWACS